MKSLEDLKKIREEAKRKMTMRLGEEQKYRVVVGMATCGIAAGARPVLNALVEEVSRLNIPVTVTQTGCIGLCSLEPIVEVFDAKGEKTTYVLMNSEKAKQVALKHLKNDEVVEEYTIGQYKK